MPLLLPTRGGSRRILRSLNFGGLTDKIDCGAGAATASLLKGSCLFFGRMFDLTGQRHIWRRRPGSSSDENFRFIAATPNQLTLVISRATTALQVTASLISMPSIAASEWAFLAATWDGNLAAQDQRIYHGNLRTPLLEVSAYVQQGAGSGTVGDNSSTSLIVGNSPVGGGTQSWGDRISALLICKNYCLSLLELQNLQERLIDGAPLWPVPGLAGLWYPGENGTGTVYDESGNGNNGTITGATPADGAPLVWPPRRWRISVPTALVSAAMASAMESLGAASQAVAGAHESLALATSSPASAHEAVQGLSTPRAGSHESLAGLSAVAIAALEALAAAVATAAGVQEAVAPVSTGSPSSLEALAAAVAAVDAAHEAAAAANSSAPSAHEALAAIAAGSTAIHEALGAMAAAVHGAHEALANLAAQAISSLESLAPVASSTESAHESDLGITVIMAAVDSALESLAALDVAQAQAQEALSPASTTASSAIEALQGASADTAAAQEALASLTTQAAATLEAMAHALAAATSAHEALQAVAPMSASSAMEVLQGLLAKVDSAHESLRGTIEALVAALLGGVVGIELLGGALPAHTVRGGVLPVVSLQDGGVI